MNILSEIEKAIVAIPGQRTNSKFGKFGRRGHGNTLRRGYTASTWAFKCCQILGNTSASMPFGMFENNELQEEDHPAMKLFGFINETSNPEDWIRNTVIDMNIHGYGITWPEFVGNKIVRLHRIPAGEARLEDRENTGQQITQIVWNRGGRQSVIPREQVALFRLYGSLELDSDSPMRVVMDKVVAEQKIDELARAHFDSMGIPPYVFSSDQNVAEKDLKRYNAWWKKLYEGVKNRFRVAFVGGGLKPERLRAPLKEMVLKELREAMAIEVCAAFGVPAGIAGARQIAFKATWVQQMISMHHLKIIPDLRLMEGVINAEIMPLVFDGEAEFRFLPENVEMLQEERTARSNRILAEWQSGLIDHPSALQILGYEQNQAGPGLVAGIARSPGRLTPGGNEVEREKAQVRRKARRLLEQTGGLDGFEWNPDVLSQDEVFRLVEGVISE